jgi:hypothetical protein
MAATVVLGNLWGSSEVRGADILFFPKKAPECASVEKPVSPKN